MLELQKEKPLRKGLPRLNIKQKEAQKTTKKSEMYSIEKKSSQSRCC